jgi:hypothetical protein
MPAFMHDTAKGATHRGQLNQEQHRIEDQFPSGNGHSAHAVFQEIGKRKPLNGLREPSAGVRDTCESSSGGLGSD